MKRTTATAGLVTALAFTLSGCMSSASSPGSSATTAPTAASAVTRPGASVTTATLAATMPDVVHDYLDSAQNQLKALGLSNDHVVTSTLGANSIVVEPGNWIVLTQTPAAGRPLTSGSVVHLGVAKLNDPKAAGITPRS